MLRIHEHKTNRKDKRFGLEKVKTSKTKVKKGIQKSILNQNKHKNKFFVLSRKHLQK